MVSGLGSVSGQIRIDAKQALSEYAALRSANEATMIALRSSSATFAKIGTMAIAAAAPIVLLFAAAVDASAKFQKKMSFIQAITKGSASDMQEIANSALAMAKTTAYSADQIADAYVTMAKAGLSTKDILGGVGTAVANLAQASDINISDAANIMIASMKTFGIGASGAEHIADQMQGAAHTSVITVNDLATTLKYAGSIAAATHVPFDDLVTAISLLGQSGIKGSNAGTSLRQIMISLVKQTGAASKEMKTLGLVTANGTNLFIDQTGHVKPLADVFQILQDHLAGLTSAQQLAAEKTIFNSRALSAVAILAKDGAAGFEKTAAAINKVGASDVAKERINNLAGDFTKLKNTISATLIQAGGPLQDVLRKIVQGVTDLVKWFGNLSPETQKNILYAIMIVGAFLLIVGAMSLMLSVILKVIELWKAMKEAAIIVKGAMLIMGDGFAALGELLMANPIVLIIAAVVALAAAFVYCWTHFKGFRDFFKDAWRDIKAWFFDAWHYIDGIMHDIVKIAEDVYNGFMNDFVHPIERAWDTVVRAFVTAYNDFYTYFVHPIMTAWRDALGAFEAAYNFISQVVSDIIDFVKVHWKAIIAIILGPLGLVIDAVTTHWAWIEKIFKDAIKLIVSLITTVWNWFYTITKFIFNLIYMFFKVQWDIISKVFTVALDVIKDIITTVWNVIKTITTTVWNFIYGILKTVFDAIWSYTVYIFDTIKDVITTVFNAVWTVISTVWNTIYGFVKTVLTDIFNVFKNVFQKVYNFVSGIIGDLWKPFHNALQAVWNTINGWIQKIFNVALSLAGDVISAIVKTFEDAGTIGYNLVVGIWNGIAGMATWLWDKVSKFISNIWDNILNWFGIHSPSKKAMDAGQFIVMGLANGITGSKNLAVKAMKDLNDSVQAAGQLVLNPGSLGTNSKISIAASMNATSSQSYKLPSSPTTQSGPAVNIENLNMINPKQEPTSKSLPRAIRRVSYISPGPAR